MGSAQAWMQKAINREGKIPLTQRGQEPEMSRMIFKEAVKASERGESH